MTYGRDDVYMFKRTIPKRSIHRAISILGLSTLLVVSATILLLATEKGQAFNHQPGYTIRVLFEVVSAFGTVGLSTGITPQLSTVGRLLLSLVMLVGRIGPLTVALAVGNARSRPAIHYPKARITVG